MKIFSRLFKYKFFIFLIFTLIFITILAIILILNINSINSSMKNLLLTTAFLLLWVLLSFFIIKYLCLKLFNKIVYLQNTWKMDFKKDLELKFANDLDIVKKDLELKFANDLDIVKKDLELKFAKDLIKYITTTHLSETSFISHSCLAGELYRRLDLPYLSPFIDILFERSIYCNLLKDIKFHLSQPITCIPKKNALTFPASTLTDYPVSQLGTPDIEFHWIHSHSEEDVLNNWNRRKKRINYKKIITVDNDTLEKYKNKFFRNIQLNDGSIEITKNKKTYTFLTRKALPHEIADFYWPYYQYQFDIIKNSLEMILLLI